MRVLCRIEDEAAASATSSVVGLNYLFSLPFWPRQSAGMWERIWYYLACLLLPIVWGVLINWIFNRWSSRQQKAGNSAIQDYQI